MIDLFHVRSSVKKLHGHRDVCLDWFVVDRARPIAPYAELIAGYDEPSDHDYTYPKGAVDELFSAAEARALIEYLDKHLGTESTQSMKQAGIPIDRNTCGLGAIPVGGPQGFLMLSERNEWPLPFKVWGYYDLRGHVPDCQQATAGEPF